MFHLLTSTSTTTILKKKIEENVIALLLTTIVILAMPYEFTYLARLFLEKIQGIAMSLALSLSVRNFDIL